LKTTITRIINWQGILLPILKVAKIFSFCDLISFISLYLIKISLIFFFFKLGFLFSMESEEVSLTYEDRMKEREKILLKIDKEKTKLGNLNMKIADIEKQLNYYKLEVFELESNIKNLQDEFMQKGIPVPLGGNFEISNGLVGVKRDLNLKLIRDVGEKDMRQVFQ
jgi:hypothetical protein